MSLRATALGFWWRSNLPHIKEIASGNDALAMTFAVLRFFFRFFNGFVEHTADSQHHFFAGGSAVFHEAFG